jgi:DNA/RNA endonuclease YhcR with UshA esterase domain
MAGCVDFHDAAPHAGETGCVCGRVLRVFASRGGNTFLDFCEDYRDCPFTSVIFSSDKNKFGDLASLAGRQIEIRGPITVYQGKPEIIIRDPEQIRLAP